MYLVGQVVCLPCLCQTSLHSSRLNRTTVFLANVFDRLCPTHLTYGGVTTRVGLVPLTREPKLLEPSAHLLASSRWGHRGGFGSRQACSCASLIPLLEGTMCQVGTCCLPVRCWLVMRVYLGMWLSGTGLWLLPRVPV